MKRPTSEQVKQARDRVRSKGPLSEDVAWASLMAIQDPECSDCCTRIQISAFGMLDLREDQRLLLQGIVNGAFASGLHIALELEREEPEP